MSKPRIVITAGEPAGVGPDVVLRALQFELAASVAVIGDIGVLRDRADLLGISCDIHCLKSRGRVATRRRPPSGASHSMCTSRRSRRPERGKRALCRLNLNGCRADRDGLYDAVVTAPVQKSIINDSGIPFSGHTEFFADFFHCDDVVMLLANQQFKVALATTHLPLRDVADAISRDSLCRQLRIIARVFQNSMTSRDPKSPCWD